MASGYDVVIVGAGSAGCVLAARLSEEPARSVLLLEAGPDYPDPGSLPADLASSRSGITDSHDWGYFSEPGSLGRSIQLLRAKVVGGCSATNATAAVRGHTPFDYDRWAAMGNSGWSFAEVLPSFQRLEADADFADEWHGRDGPIPIRRYRREDMTHVQRAFLDASQECGHPPVADHNAPGAVGAGPWPRNMVGEQRQSTAVTYLAQARSRPNLTIRSGELADRVVLDRARAYGVLLAGGETLWADRVILSAGALGSPALLLRSGVGPGPHLRDMGIAVAEDVPGVGDGLMDHPLMGVRLAAPHRAAPDFPAVQALLTAGSSRADHAPDLMIFPWAILPAPEEESPSGTIAVLEVSLIQPLSRGRLRLRSADPAAAPVVDLGYFTHPEDMPRMIEGVRLARRLAKTAPLSAVVGEEIFPGPGKRSDADLRHAILGDVGTFFHQVGTCRMGPKGDDGAVVDVTGRVRGIDGLWVVDASIMPVIPAGNTNIPTIMVAERCAEWLRQ